MRPVPQQVEHRVHAVVVRAPKVIDGRGPPLVAGIHDYLVIDRGQSRVGFCLARLPRVQPRSDP